MPTGIDVAIQPGDYLTNQPEIQTRLEALEKLRIETLPDLPLAAQELISEIADLFRKVTATEMETFALDRLATSTGSGVLLENVLEDVYNGFRDVIPYDRIGFSLIEDEAVTARWARSDTERIRLGAGYSLPIAKTSLARILGAKRPRIINDLETYLEQHPRSQATRLLVAEGVRSSLTCPLFADGVAVGFLFFSSKQKGTYSAVHTRTFERIADQLSAVIEKGRLTSQLADRADAIEEQNRQLQDLNEAKNTFIGMASHDLRSPLATIQTAADLLDEADYLAPEERKMFIKDIRQQAGYMLTLVNELLDMAQIESGKLELRTETFDLSELLADAVKRHSLIAGPKHIQVTSKPSPKLPVSADATRIRQVVDNLLSNAIKYSPSESSVEVSAVETSGRVRVSVRDRGPGIGAHDQARLFEYFETANARPTGGETSTGLGLAIARRMIEAHRGEIGVDSAIGQGSTFWFEIPLL